MLLVAGHCGVAKRDNLAQVGGVADRHILSGALILDTADGDHTRVLEEEVGGSGTGKAEVDLLVISDLSDKAREFPAGAAEILRPQRAVDLTEILRIQKWTALIRCQAE